MRVLVTGSSGMIGSTLCERLLAAGHQVVPVDRAPNPWNPALDDATVRADLLDDQAVTRLPRDVDWVVHLAANARVHDLVVDPVGARENLVTSFNALEHARRADAFFVFASSREVYGNQPAAADHAFGEDEVSTEHIESPYSASKIAAELMTRSYGKVYGTSYAIVRFSNVYGRNDTSDRFVPILFRTALSGADRTVRIFGKEKSLDFTYIDDVLDGLEALIEHPGRAHGRTFNMSRGQAVTLLEAASMVAELTGRPLEIDIQQSRPGEVLRYVGDISLAREQLGYTPTVDLWEGLQRAASWYTARHTA